MCIISYFFIVIDMTICIYHYQCIEFRKCNSSCFNISLWFMYLCYKLKTFTTTQNICVQVSWNEITYPSPTFNGMTSSHSRLSVWLLIHVRNGPGVFQNLMLYDIYFSDTIALKIDGPFGSYATPGMFHSLTFYCFVKRNHWHLY